jgi:hypothetical protein
MPRPAEWFKRFDPITADFTYIRWLGDRKGIEEKTKTWDKTIVDRTSELQEWVEYCYLVQKRVVCAPDDPAGRGITIYAYAHDPMRIVIPSDQREPRGPPLRWPRPRHRRSVPQALERVASSRAFRRCRFCSGRLVF